MRLAFNAGVPLQRLEVFYATYTGSTQAAAPAPPPRPPQQQTEVLFLSSSDPDLPDVASMIEQTQTHILEGCDTPVHLSFEYLDLSSSSADPSRKRATASDLREKYRGQTFHLVIAIGDDTLACRTDS